MTRPIAPLWQFGRWRSKQPPRGKPMDDNDFLRKIHFEQADDDETITYTIRMPKQQFGRWPPLRSGLMTQHGIAGWTDDIQMEEGDGVYKMNRESLAFLMMNAAYILANSEVEALEAGIRSVEVRA